MRHLERGSAIINTGSVTAYRGSPELLDYSATKGAIMAFTRSLARAVVEKGIRVNGVHPTVTLTPMAIKAWSDPEKAAGMLKRIPVGRFAESQDVAEVILFLLSDEAAMVNGISMPVDGGYMIA